MNSLVSVEKGIKEFLKPAYFYLKNGEKRGFIYMLHRVGERNTSGIAANRELIVTRETLSAFLETCTGRFDFIRLEDVPGRLREKTDRPFLVFTLDDGYKDNFTNAYPVFKKYGVPFTVFVTTCFPDRNAVLWWLELEDLLYREKCVRLGDGTVYRCDTQAEKDAAFLEIRKKILRLDQKNLKAELDSLFAGYSIDWSAKCSELCLSWEEIRCLDADSLVTIGAHGTNHWNLKTLNTREEVLAEIRNGAEELKKQLGHAPQVFAYPYGYRSRKRFDEENILQELGFRCSCVIRGGYCGVNNQNDLQALPRIMLTEEMLGKV